MTENKSKSTFSGEIFRIALPLSILAAGLVACVILYEMRIRPSEHVVEKSEAPTVETVPILSKTGGFEIVLGGEVVPYREIEIAAEVCGRLVTDRARAGHFARKGDLLLEIDPTNYELDVRRLTEEARQAEIRLEENAVETENVRLLTELARQEHALQIKERDRIVILVRKHAVSESEHDAAERNLIAARRTLAELENQAKLLEQKRGDLQSTLKQAEILLARAGEDLKRCRIVAPCDGMIVRDHSEPGNYVSVGRSLFVFEDVTKVEVRCRLRAKELYWLWLQQSGKETPDALPEDVLSRSCYEIPETKVAVSWTIEGRTWNWKGKLSRYDGHGIDAATRTAAVRIEIPAPRDALASGPNHEIVPPALARGVYVTASIHVDPGVPLWRVPTAALRAGNKIYAAENERLEIHDVQVVQRNKDFSVIRMLSSETFPAFCVVSPLASPRHGMPIRLLENAATPPLSDTVLGAGIVEMPMASNRTGGPR